MITETKVCLSCKESLPIARFGGATRKKTGVFKYFPRCKSCITKIAKEDRKSFLAENGISRQTARRKRSSYLHMKSMLASARARSKRRGCEYELDADFMLDLYQRQGGRCAVTGKEMTLISGSRFVGTNVSIDRRDNSKGYTRENVRLVTRWVNIGKSTMTPEDFIMMCLDVVKDAGLMSDKACNKAKVVWMSEQGITLDKTKARGEFCAVRGGS